MSEFPTPSDTDTSEAIDLDQLLTEVAPLVDAMEVRGFEMNRWGIALDEATVIEVELDEATGKLFLTTSLGRVNEGDETSVYKLLLQLATLFRENGGLRMGLDPVTDSVILIQDLPVASLSLEVLERELKDFIEAGTQTVALLDATPDPAEASAEQPSDHLASTLRV
ncbi:MAG: type III secretion system chaperone [Verrucomicrobium sp.]|nr:type III secretion system chaperone [Verrucomicrobium sp.]